MGHDVIVEEMVIPQEVPGLTKPLPMLGHGVTEMEIHFLQIKHNAISVYADTEDITSHVQKWKGKSGKELAEDDDFFHALATAPVEIVIRVAVIKEIKAAQYGAILEGAVRDRLAAADKYEEEEETALEKVAEFFPTKYYMKGSLFTFKFPASGGPAAEIVLTSTEGDETKMTVDNGNVAEMMKKWYLGGTRGVSPSTVESVANTISTKLSSC